VHEQHYRFSVQIRKDTLIDIMIDMLTDIRNKKSDSLLKKYRCYIVIYQLLFRRVSDESPGV